jgi:hypothetical protein
MNATTNKNLWEMTCKEWQLSTGLPADTISKLERGVDVLRGRRKRLSPGEYRDLVAQGLAQDNYSPNGNFFTLTGESLSLIKAHLHAVVQALREGLPVPAEVVASYPHLKDFNPGGSND